ncbi:MAG TPA: excinuclease ABC subunit C, partial [Deltaproteobacteria bacterium]|nr:excinuclease ABC subunit C [Deltaproteobacteria bacterium]
AGGVGSFAVQLAKARGATQDRFYLPGRKDPVRLGPKSKAMLTLQRLRDEAHRFAVGYHRRLRSKGNITSLFEDIPGIGPVKARALLQLASRGRDISAIGRSDLEGLGCLNRKDIEHILDHLNRLRP